MSAYALQQYMFDALRAPGLSAQGYELSDRERAALDAGDIAAFHVIGVHPVLLNAWCRSIGLTRDSYRELLAPYRHEATERPRWRS